MSAAPSPALAAAVEQVSATGITTHPKKSYRRKYRKIMVKFEERMRESTGLFKDEQRIFDISQRLAEQTDQILELLLELNNTPQIPNCLRYDLKPASVVSSSNLPEQNMDKEAAHESLRLARDRVQKGDMAIHEYNAILYDLRNTPLFAPSKSYASLVKSIKFNPITHDPTDDLNVPAGVGTLTIKQEEQYLQSLDEYLTGKPVNPRSHAMNSLGNLNAEKTTDREREFQQKNPVSVYNWLRKHQPQVFLQDHEAPGDKTSKAAGSRSSKRTTGGKDVKQENEQYDTDGIAVDYNASLKGKRKRDDDGAFRPKGGKSGHPAKRRKEEIGSSSKKFKRPSLDARNS